MKICLETGIFYVARAFGWLKFDVVNSELPVEGEGGKRVIAYPQAGSKS